jgi:archaellum component FlaG (FlaF/FlaG flagellin family)
MAEYEVKESEYVSGKEIKDLTGVVFEILDEVKDAPSDFGTKPKCQVNVITNAATTKKMWTLNQQNVNFFVEKIGKNSTEWVGKKVEVFTEVIKGNVSIRVKELKA